MRDAPGLDGQTNMFIAMTAKAQEVCGRGHRLSGQPCPCGTAHGAFPTCAACETLTRLKISRSAWVGAGPPMPSPPERIPAPLPLLAGHKLGPYRLLKRLGRGGQGDVWKAVRVGPLNQFVALKFLNPALARSPARMAQFRREAERGARLAGPSLLPVYELTEIDGHHFMSMPCVDGTALREVIRCRFAFLSGDETENLHPLVTMEEVKYFRLMTRTLAKAARALARVHEQRIAHRDIKPANILLPDHPSGEVYLCDFGLGRDLEIATSEQMRDGAGTPMYMAPERLLRRAADEVRCDIYSIGVTLFEALTLERPFQVPEHVTLAGLAPFLASAEPRAASAVVPAFPGDVEAVITKAMARDPRHRYDSARALADDLERAILRRSARWRRSWIEPPHRSHIRETIAPLSRALAKVYRAAGAGAGSLPRANVPAARQPIP
jgi:eukaryotic-like serine/threonine-protein kinase